MKIDNTCNFCAQQFLGVRPLEDRIAMIHAECPSCGVYAYPQFDNDFESVKHRWLASAIIRSFNLSRRAFPIILPKSDVVKMQPPPGWVVVSTEEFLCRDIPSVDERLDRALVNLSRMQQSIGQAFKIYPDRDKSIVWAENGADSQWIMTALGELDWTTYRPSVSHIEGQNLNPALLTPLGWRRVHELGTNQALSGKQTAFVAMWFDEQMLHVFDRAIKPAIEDAGYEAIRIDKTDHLNKIDDEIIVQIRRSRFLVADFTGSRGGVYFEAGFAQGLGKPVIFTVDDGHMQHVHFDTNHFPHILWDADALDEFREKLKLRILATIGQGPD